MPPLRGLPSEARLGVAAVLQTVILTRQPPGLLCRPPPLKWGARICRSNPATCFEILDIHTLKRYNIRNSNKKRGASHAGPENVYDDAPVAFTVRRLTSNPEGNLSWTNCPFFFQFIEKRKDVIERAGDCKEAPPVAEQATEAVGQTLAFAQTTCSANT